MPGYRLVRLLSKTATSEVYLAEEVAGQRRRVALKVFDLAGTAPGTAARFSNEIRIATGLRHPNIVETFETGETAGHHYIAMHFVEGPDLRRLLHEQGPLDLGRTLDIARQIASALDAAHQRRLVHRDVKPGNILVDAGTGQVYLCDFGIAKDLLALPITTDGPPLTPLYAAPEQQTAGAAVDRRADVYALAGVLYHCLTGRPPYDLHSTSAVLAAHRGSLPPRISGERRDLPALLDEVFARGLAKRPADRYADCPQLVADLAAIAEGRARPALPRRRRSSRWRVPWLLGTLRGRVVVAAGVAVVAAAVLVAVQPWRGSSPTDLSWVPAALRAGCETVDTAAFPGADESVSCQDSADDATVTVGRFADDNAVNSAYAQAIGRVGLTRDSGDCVTATGAEHRYPGSGATKGRVACYVQGAMADVIWTDSGLHAVARASAPVAHDAGLRRSWSRWVGIPAFPTTEERALVDLVGDNDCHRAAAGDMDAFTDVVAGVTCVPPGAGATSESYYRFGSLADLRAAFNADATAVKAPNGVDCATGKAAGFLGNQRYDLRSVDLGGLLCHPGQDSALVMEWSVEPLLVLGRASGAVPAALSGWWQEYHGPPESVVVTAVNRQADPTFPTARETALLAHIPPASRHNCIRPSNQQVRLNVGDAPVVGVVCGPTSGAAIVFYYQFASVAAMHASYGAPEIGGEDCTGQTTGFNGEHAYTRGRETGRLTCSSDSGRRSLTWTDDRLAIEVEAFQGGDPAAMIDWWRYDAGPS